MTTLPTAMTGPEHYREAERLLSEASFTGGVTEQPVTRDGLPRTPGAHAALIARAQVHATLALAAATAEAGGLIKADPCGNRSHWAVALNGGSR